MRVTAVPARPKNLQVRFRDVEFDELAAYAEQRGLPVSTVVRTLVLQAIAPADDLQSAFDRPETDLAAMRRKALMPDHIASVGPAVRPSGWWTIAA